MRTWLWLICLIYLPSCANPDETEFNTPPGYRSLYAEVFVPGCSNGPCHSGSRGVAGLSFDELETSYAQLVDTGAVSSLPGKSRRVIPGDADGSLLWKKLSLSAEALVQLNLGAAMPMGGIARPDETTLGYVWEWIEAGAPLEGREINAAFIPPTTGYLACEAESPEALRDCLTPMPTDGSIRLTSGPIKIEPHSEIVVCSEVKTLEDELLVQSFVAQQMVGGHHLALFTAVAPTGDSDAVDCLTDMTRYRFVTAGDSKGERTTLPADRALRIAAGETLVLQSHYINTTSQPRWVMDTVDLLSPSNDESITITDALILNTTDIDIPAGADEYEVTKTCELTHAVTIEQVTGHTHENGVWLELLAHRQGQEPVRLFHSTDGPVLRDFAGFETTEMRLEAGDSLSVTCRWTNPTNEPLRFPREMCAGVTYYTPGRGALLCDTHDTTPRPWSEVVSSEAADQGEGCAAEGDMGNELGVGRYCTPTGGECVGLSANFCLAAFNPTANYCSVILCDSDEQCGMGAACVAGDGGTACVPDSCQ